MAQQHPNQANSFQPPTYDESFNNNDLAKIFVGGLSWETSDQVLRDYFSTYGVVNDVVIMRDRITGRSRGFGFVTFEDEQSADAAVLEQHVIEGRKVEAKKAIPKGEMPNKSKKVFVGGIPLNTTDVQFKKYFEQFGVVTDCQIMKERQTGRPRGFGFVTFESDQSVADVLQTQHEINGKFVEVKQAQPKKPIPPPSNINMGGFFSPGPYGPGSVVPVGPVSAYQPPYFTLPYGPPFAEYPSYNRPYPIPGFATTIPAQRYNNIPSQLPPHQRSNNHPIQYINTSEHFEGHPNTPNITLQQAPLYSTPYHSNNDDDSPNAEYIQNGDLDSNFGYY